MNFVKRRYVSGECKSPCINLPHNWCFWISSGEDANQRCDTSINITSCPTMIVCEILQEKVWTTWLVGMPNETKLPIQGTFVNLIRSRYNSSEWHATKYQFNPKWLCMNFVKRRYGSCECKSPCTNLPHNWCFWISSEDANQGCDTSINITSCLTMIVRAFLQGQVRIRWMAILKKLSNSPKSQNPSAAVHNDRLQISPGERAKIGMWQACRNAAIPKGA
jgi:hypothetical protein